jgi:hypothetical protein
MKAFLAGVAAIARWIGYAVIVLAVLGSFDVLDFRLCLSAVGSCMK